MKKVFYALSVSVIIIFLTSCSTMDIAKNFNGRKITTTNDEPIAHINSMNYGYYLFSFIPLWTGRPGHPNGFSLFTDQVTVDKMIDQVTKKSKELGGTKVVNLQSETSYTGGFSLWIFWLCEVQVSGDAVK